MPELEELQEWLNNEIADAKTKPDNLFNCGELNALIRVRHKVNEFMGEGGNHEESTR